MRTSIRSGAGPIRWSISDYIPNTLHDNFALFEKYPDYIFNFSGSNRYKMIKEYYPADYERLKQYVAQGRWFPCGSSVEECDVNATVGGVDHPPGAVRQPLLPH